LDRQAPRKQSALSISDIIEAGRRRYIAGLLREEPKRSAGLARFARMRLATQMRAAFIVLMA
jgi:hypothetical protein